MPDAPQTRPSLILRLKNRDDLDAWQEFTEIYQPLVYRIALKRGFQHNDAADITQEVLVRVAGAVERWQPDPHRGTFRGWLYRIARNLMISFLEKQDRQPAPTGHSSIVDLLAQVPDSHDIASGEFDDELAQQVFAWAARRVQATCNTSTWQAFWSTAVEDEPPAQVASRLKISVGAVYVARSRIIQKLRREVQRFSGHPEQQEVPV